VAARALVEWMVIGLVAGELVAAAGWWPGAPGALAVAGALLVGACALARDRRTRPVGLLGMAAIAAALAGGTLVARAMAIPDDPAHVARLSLPVRARITGTVASTPLVAGDRTVFVLAAETVEAATQGRVWGRIRVRVRQAVALERGARISLTTTLRRPRNFENPGRFDLVGMLARRRIHVVASVWDAAAIERVEPRRGPSGGGVERLLVRWREAVRAVLSTAGTPPVTGVLQALVLGDERDIAPELRRAFTRAGVVHVLSVSGLHVGIVAAAAGAALAWLAGRSEWWLVRCDRRTLVLGGGLVMATVYGGLTGFAVATVRALVMAAVVVAAVVLDRRVDPMRALALAAGAIAVLEPGAPAEISYQLSFASVAALILGARGRTPSEDGGRWLRRAGRAALAAWVGTAPLTAFHFHEVSLVSVLANPMLVPLFEACALLPALAGAVAAPLAPELARAAFVLAGIPVALALAMVRVVGAWSWAAIDVPLPSLGELALLYGVVFGGWYRRAPGARLLAAVCLAALAMHAAWWAHDRFGRRTLRATFLDVGQGDAAVVELAGGRVLVVDAGGFAGSDFDTGAAIVEPFLRARKVGSIDALVLSHAHPDHAGGLAHLVRRLAPDELWWSGSGGTGRAWEEIVRALRETGTPVRRLRAGDAIAGFPEVDVLHPPVAWDHRSLNEGSLVLRVFDGMSSVLLTGDAEVDAEAAMLAAPDRLRSSVLKVPHHGSRTSSGWRFVEAVDPAVAVVSAGADNRFGHPAPEVLARYARRGTIVRRTDRCGAVTVEHRDGWLQVRGMRAECDRVAPLRTRPLR
jgi:competence protein ComEC